MCVPFHRPRIHIDHCSGLDARRRAPRGGRAARAAIWRCARRGLETLLRLGVRVVARATVPLSPGPSDSDHQPWAFPVGGDSIGGSIASGRWWWCFRGYFGACRCWPLRVLYDELRRRGFRGRWWRCSRRYFGVYRCWPLGVGVKKMIEVPAVRPRICHTFRDK